MAISSSAPAPTAGTEMIEKAARQASRRQIRALSIFMRMSSEGETGLDEETVDDGIGNFSRGVAVFALESGQAGDVVAHPDDGAGEVANRYGEVGDTEQGIAGRDVGPLKSVVRLPLADLPRETIGDLHVSRA